MDNINEAHDIQVTDVAKNHEKQLKELQIVLDELTLTKDKMHQQMHSLKSTNEQQKEAMNEIQSKYDGLQKELCKQKQTIKEISTHKENIHPEMKGFQTEIVKYEEMVRFEDYQKAQRKRSGTNDSCKCGIQPMKIRKCCKKRCN
eukprot:28708_1